MIPARAKELPPQTCVICEGPTPRRGVYYCSPECKSAKQAAFDRARRPPICQDCGGPRDSRRGVRFCGECAHRRLNESARRSQRRKAEAKRAAWPDGKKPRRAPRAHPRALDDGTFICARCEVAKAPKDFADKQGKRGYCRPCQADYMTEYSLRRYHGITIEDYRAMLELQGGACAICGTKPKKRRLAVDHNHVTGQIRGLLCTICNHRLLGGAKENIEILRRAADYLEDPPCQHLGLVSPNRLAA